MPRSPRSVLDGLEDVWDGATAGWRSANAAREEAEALKAQADREAGRAIARGVVKAAGVVKAKADAAGRRGGAVVDALFGTTPSSAERQTGPVSQRVVDERRARTVADIRDGLQGAVVAGHAGASAGAAPYAAGAWLRRVWPGGEWDDKADHHPSEYKKYERQGNFSYGATAEALGLPQGVALFGAGVAQRVGNLDRAMKGEALKASEGGFRAPYGDDPRDQESIRDGYVYGRGQSRR